MRRSAFLLVACLFAASCGKTREVEPNDHFTQATVIRGRTKIQGTIHKPGDVDVYRLELARPGENLAIRVSGVRQIDFVLSVLDSDRRVLKRYDETSVGGDERALDIGIAKGPCYIRVSNKNAQAAPSRQPYTLTVDISPGAEKESEPNDRALQATALSPGGIVRGHYYPSTNLLAEENEFFEEDWYRINVKQEGMFLLNVDLSEVPKVDTVLEIYGPNSYKIKEVDEGGVGRPEVLRGFGLRGPVHYYLRIRSKSKHAWNADIPYELLTEIIPYQGAVEFEPNDQRLEATAFAGDAIEGTLSPRGDADWYKVVVGAEQKRILTAHLGGLAGMDLRLTLADDIGKPLLKIDNLGREQPEVLTGIGVAQGDYYLVVSEKSGRKADPRSSYTLKRRIVDYQPGLEYELNNSSRSAQALKVGDSVDGYIAPKGDVDFYEFNVYSKAQIVAEVSGVLNVRMSLTLFDQEYAELAAAEGEESGQALTLARELEPGTYGLRLKAVKEGQNNIRDKYTLRIRAQ